MPMLDGVCVVIAQALLGETITAYDNTNARIGVGDSTTAYSSSQTDLQGTNKFRKGMDSGFPTRSGAVMTFKSTFNDGEANFAWNEWIIVNDASTGTAMCRKVESNGTKSGGIWVFEVDVTVGIGSA